MQKYYLAEFEIFGPSPRIWQKCKLLHKNKEQFRKLERALRFRNAE